MSPAFAFTFFPGFSIVPLADQVISKSFRFYPADFWQIYLFALYLYSLGISKALFALLFGFEFSKAWSLAVSDSSKEVLEGFIKMSDGLLQSLGVYLFKPFVALFEDWQSFDELISACF